MHTQNKHTEMAVGSGSIDDEWKEGSQAYRVRKKHLASLGLSSLHNKLILDAGCGPGTYGIMLAQEGNEVIGIEISPAAVLVANERAREKGVNFSARVGDMEKLPFKDNSFDICFCGWVLHHFPNVNAAIAELTRVLKPGGQIALAEPNESNLVVRFSRFIEDLPLLRGWVIQSEWDSPNRTINIHKVYVNTLSNVGIIDIKLISCSPGGLPPLPSATQKGIGNHLALISIKILVRVRRFIFMCAYKLLPKPLNGADLLITGIKQS